MPAERARNFLVSAALAVMLGAGCANASDAPASAPVGSPAPTTTVSRQEYPGGPGTWTAFVPDLKFTGGARILRATLPTQWSVIEDSESPATQGLIGYAAGGGLDIPLRFDIAFKGAIDDLKPPTAQACYHHGDPPYPAASVEDITAQTGDGTGFRKMGDRTAEYRVWRANCPNDWTPEQIHRAWVLPDADIAIYEQRATEFNDEVVRNMQPLR
jgi:hypothetical protein